MAVEAEALRGYDVDSHAMPLKIGRALSPALLVLPSWQEDPKPREETIRVGDRNTHVLTAGNAENPKLFLLHGLGYGARTFDANIVPLSARFHVIAPNFPGYGNSSHPQEGHTTASYITMVNDLMNELEVDTASFVGLSMGGAASLGYALDNPKRVDKLVLVDSFGLGKRVTSIVGKPTPALRIAEPLVDAGAWALTRTPFLPMAGQIALGLALRFPSLAPVALRAVVKDPSDLDSHKEEILHSLGILGCTTKASAAWLRNEFSRSGFRTNYRNRLHEVMAPTLLIHGKYDRLIPHAYAERAQRDIPDAHLVTLDTGHAPPIERAEEFNHHVAHFLAS